MSVVWSLVWLAGGAALGALAVWMLIRGRLRSTSAPVAAATERTAAAPSDTAAAVVAADAVLPSWHRALDALDLGVVICDADGGVVVRNRAAVTGPTGALHTDVLVGEAVDGLLRAARDGRAGRRVLDLFGPPARVVVVTASPLDDGAAVATVADITEQSRIDAVRTDFVANVSHELKTPVGAIAVLAETLAGETDPEVVHRFATKMTAEAHRVGRTIDDLLELSRIELGGEIVRQRVELSPVLTEAVDRVESEAARRRISVAVDCGPGVAVDGDARQLVSAMGNLIENAVKYSDDGATVQVSVHPTDDDRSEVEIRVADTGAGIPARDLDRIFERFYRVDRARSRNTGGTGLGLAIVRHVATNHGGRVTVTSTEGEGSTFSLVLPAAAGATS